jgi:hypothetical protein
MAALQVARRVSRRAAWACLPCCVLSIGLVVAAALTGMASADCQHARACGDRASGCETQYSAARPAPTEHCLLRLRGGRKGVQAKHTAKEQALKQKLATKNMGGGKEGLQDRLGGKAGHAKVVRERHRACACVVLACTHLLDWYFPRARRCLSLLLVLNAGEGH